MILVRIFQINREIQCFWILKNIVFPVCFYSTLIFKSSTLNSSSVKSFFEILILTINGCLLIVKKKSMKKFLLFIIVSITLIAGCSKDESTKGDFLIGKWQVVKFSDPSGYSPCDYSGWVKFLEGGKYEDFDACTNTTETGTYTSTSTSITITSKVFPIPITATIVSLTATTLVIESNFGGIKESVTYKKL